MDKAKQDSKILQSNIETLRSLTNKLVDFEDMVEERGPGFIEINTLTSGICNAFNLFNTDSIAIAKVSGSEGAIIANHDHNEKEWIILYEGECDIYFGKNCKKLFPGDFVHIEPGTSHYVVFIKDSKCIAITFPAAEAYPK